MLSILPIKNNVSLMLTVHVVTPIGCDWAWPLHQGLSLFNLHWNHPRWNHYVQRQRAAVLCHVLSLLKEIARICYMTLVIFEPHQFMWFPLLHLDCNSMLHLFMQTTYKQLTSTALKQISFWFGPFLLNMQIKQGPSDKDNYKRTTY